MVRWCAVMVTEVRIAQIEGCRQSEVLHGHITDMVGLVAGPEPRIDYLDRKVRSCARRANQKASKHESINPLDLESRGIVQVGHCSSVDSLFSFLLIHLSLKTNENGVKAGLSNTRASCTFLACLGGVISAPTKSATFESANVFVRLETKAALELRGDGTCRASLNNERPGGCCRQ
jgi:hypothetical protein